MYSEESINEALHDETGLVVNDVVINNIRLADDTVLLPSTEEDLRRQVEKENESCTAFDMEFNAKRQRL